MRLLNEEIKIVKVEDHTAAGTTDVTSDGVDLSANGGWDGVLFITSVGTAAADNLMHAEQSSDDGSADTYGDLEGGEIDLSGASDEDQWLDVFRPTKKWVRVVAQRGTSSTQESIWAILYRGRQKKYSNLTSGTIYGKALISPAEGTK